MHHPTDRITHTTTFVALAGTRNAAAVVKYKRIETDLK